MPRYFFDTDDGTDQVRDEIGLEFPDDQAARDEGSRAIAEIARDYIPGGAWQKNITMWVRRADGAPLLDMTVSFATQPAR